MKRLLIPFAGLSALAFAQPAHDLSVGEGLVNPLGFHDATPAFSWKLPDGVKKQTAYRLQTKVGEKSWDSGWVESEESAFVTTKAAPLGSRERVAWRVNFRDETGREGGWSETANFEMGLLSADDWKAKWIRPAQQSDPITEPVATLRRGFSIAKKVKQARLYVTARGVFELHLNGRRVGNDHFANGFTSYHKRLDTLAYDVTEQLQSGDNTLTGTLGSGWFAGRLPFDAKKAGPYGNHPQLLAQLEISYADGTRETIATDEKWQGSFGGPIVSSSIYDGENYDARRSIADWQPVATDGDLGKAALTPKPFAPVRETETLATQAISEPQPGRFVFDLGQNMVGWARVKIPVVKEQTITIRFAEMLNKDGTLYNANYRSAKSTDTYTAAESGVIEWQPHFTFHGFRYVELSGFSEGVKPEKDWVTGIVLHTDYERSGNFTSSHAKLNQLQSNIVWGWRGNSLDIPTDCPQRDERMGWTGDAQAFCPTAMLNTSSHGFWKSWLRSMRDDQEKDGSIPDIIPGLVHWKNSPGWVDAATFVPWEVYLRTGDIDVLDENLEMMRKLVGWYRSQSVDHLQPKADGYGDWLQPHSLIPQKKGDVLGSCKGDTPLHLLSAAFSARSTQILADAERVLGHRDEARKLDDEAGDIRAAFAKHYFDADGYLQNAPETQSAYVLALAFDLLPENLRPKAAAHIVRLVGEAGSHLRTGFLGTPYLVRVLDETGHTDLACELLFQESYPSWFYSINQGATTMWERWNSYSHEDGFGNVEMNSFNHYAYGAIGQWMMERIAGIAPDPAQPGYKHFFIRPLFVKQLDHAQAEIDTPYGKITSSWQRQGGKVIVEVTVPPNTTATVEQLEPKTLLPGKHQFEIE